MDCTVHGIAGPEPSVLPSRETGVWGTFGGHRKAVRDRLALQGGTGPGRAPKPMHVATFILPSGPISLHTSQTAEPPFLTANLRKVRKELK